MQVLVEVTIAEVSLNNNLQYGVEWFFNNKVDSRLKGLGNLDLGNAGIAALAPGFSYALQGSGNAVKAVINLLASESKLSIVSSPALLVLNNQEATIQVGDEVPVSTQQQQATATDANIINSIEYRQTGLMLKVKPRINAGGLVVLEVAQEASLVPSANNADPLTPRIQTRKISSTIAVNSGDTVMLGDLIENNQDRSAAGMPLLHQLPWVGHLFGATANNRDRTELLILITPRAISHQVAMLQATESFRRKMQRLIPILKPVGSMVDMEPLPIANYHE
jgi:general secretion pathway protein D